MFKTLRPLPEEGKIPRRDREKRRYFRVARRNARRFPTYLPEWAKQQQLDALQHWLDAR